MKKLSLFLIFCLLAISITSAAAETGKAGQAGAFLKFGLGARALGMGGAFCSIAEGIDAVYYNPAGLAFAEVKQIGFTYHNLTLDRNLNSAAFIFPVRNEAVIGLSWINSSVSDVPMRDSDRNVYDSFANSNNVFGLSFSKMFFEGFSVAGNLKYLQATLDQLDSYTIGVDLGVLYRIQNTYAVGLAFQDLGSEYRWDSSNYWSGSGGRDHDDKFPIKIRGGVSGTFLNETLVASMDVEAIEDILLKIHAGAEYWFIKQVNLIVPDEESEDELMEKSLNKRVMGLRAGYSDGSLTFGLSLYYPYGKLNGGFDYAFVAGKRDEGSNHVITMRVLF